MSAAVCPSCGTAHGPAQRYCLGCGLLVGQRSVEIEQALAYRRGGSGAAEPVAASPVAASPTASAAASPTASVAASPTTPVAPVSVWRRPVTSIATALALVAGVTAGFLTDPQGGAAGSPPVVLSGLAGKQTTPSSTTTETTTAPPTTGDAPTDSTSPKRDVKKGAAKAPSASAAAKTSPGPAATPAPADATPQPSAGANASSPSPTGGNAKTPPSKRAKAPSSADGKQHDTKVAAGLPRISHIWVIGIGAPVAPRDGSYLGETLLSRATELPKYTPVSTDPLAGAAALIAGQEPSATAKTIASQLTAAKRSWRAYAPGTPRCSDAPGTNPFLAFPSVTSAPSCADGIASLSALPADLTSADATPAFSYLATDPTLDPTALDDQLKQIVEPIRKSAAFKASGLIAIVPTAASPIGPTGALVLSPFAAGSTSIGTSFGPYSLLRTFEDLLGLDRLGHAADKDVKALGPDILAPND